MIDTIFALIAITLNAAGSSERPESAAGTNAGVTPAPEAAAAAAAPQAGGLVAEPQVATGKFTTALEVKPIMQATRPNWVAVREYDGNDLIYMTQLLSWRCGLARISYSINGGPMLEWPMPPCQLDTNAPNAIPSDAKIYEVHPPGSIQTVDIELIYDDLSGDAAHYERNQIRMP